MDLVSKIIEKIPKPNREELPELYDILDNMALSVDAIITDEELGLFEPGTAQVRFDKADSAKFKELILKNRKVMVPFFVMLCGFSVRELERQGIANVYNPSDKDVEKLAKIIEQCLRHPLHLETVLYKFYKNWEEHQKRHYRGRSAEILVIEMLKKHNIPAGKLKVECQGKNREIDCAIPPDPKDLKVVILIRRGVRRDLVKRAKEFSAEMDELLACYPNARFVVVYFIHEKEKKESVIQTLNEERQGKRPYDAVVVTEEELQQLVAKIKEWLGRG